MPAGIGDGPDQAREGRMTGKTPRRRPPKDDSRRRARGLLHIGTALPRAAGPALRRRGVVYARLVTEWSDIFRGDLIANGTRPERLMFSRGRKGGTLHIRVASGGLALELQHLAPQLIERLNRYLGKPLIAELRFRQGPLPPRRRPHVAPKPELPPAGEAALDDKLEGIQNEELREALRRLGRSVASRESGASPGPAPKR